MLEMLVIGLALWLLWKLAARVFLGTLYAIGRLVTRPVWLARAILRAFRSDVRRLAL